MYFLTGDLRASARKSHSARMLELRRGRVPCPRKGEDAEAAVRLDHVAELNGLRIGDADNRRGMKAHADREPFGEMLMRRLRR